jgi:hypothetical protein
MGSNTKHRTIERTGRQEFSFCLIARPTGFLLFKRLPNWGVLLAVVIHLGTLNVLAQDPIIDTAMNINAPEEENSKLGARWTVGGLYGFTSEYGGDFSDRHPLYGMHAGGLFPVSAQVDLVVAGEYQQFPGWTYSTSQPYYAGSMYSVYTLTERVLTTTILPSSLASLPIGFRIYARTRRLDPLVASMSARLQRPFWRKRADRRGFHFGLYTGPIVGWHKRVTRTLPENWPVNVQVPESAMEQHEQTYIRWYWSGTYEVGWTFNGRVDLTLTFMEVARFERADSDTYDLASSAFAQIRLGAALSIVLGRTSLLPL